LANNLKYMDLIFIEYWIETALMSIGAYFFASMQRSPFSSCLLSRFFIGYWIKTGWISILALLFLGKLPPAHNINFSLMYF